MEVAVEIVDSGAIEIHLIPLDGEDSQEFLEAWIKRWERACNEISRGFEVVSDGKSYAKVEMLDVAERYYLIIVEVKEK